MSDLGRRLNSAIRPAASSARWLPAGTTAEVGGFTLLDGMIYFGKGLGAIKAWANEPEPSLIDPALSVAKRSPDVEGRRMGYWASYHAIDPSCRAAYLQWLAGGRVHPGIGIGYVFLFFYGLERRLLFDNGKSRLAATEIDTIFREVERLLKTYGHNDSFRRYASSLLGLGPLLRNSIDFSSIPPPMQRDVLELPIVTRTILGLLAKESKPLPAEWALSWVVTSPEVYLRTPALRCPEEFRELFLHRYREAYGDGIKLHPNKTALKLEYRPASSSFRGAVTLTTDLPDLARTTATFEKVRHLAERCSQDLDPYSRWVGRTGETQSPPAIALLPPPLSRTRGDESTRKLEGWLEEKLNGQDLALVDSSELWSLWPGKEKDRATRRELETLSDFLASRGLGLEPDVALGGPAFTRSPKAALFRLHAGGREKPSSTFEGASVLLRLAAGVAAADGEVSATEEQRLLEHIEASLNLSTTERTRLHAQFRWLTSDPPSPSSAKKGLESVGLSERQDLGSFLISLAGADGHLNPEEIKILDKIYKVMGLDTQSLYSDVHTLMSSQAAPAQEPTPVRGPDLPQGFAIPEQEASLAAPGVISLDLDKVRAKLAETERVSRLLGGIFVDEVEAHAAAPPPSPPVVDDFAIAGLDGLHSALLLRLSGADRCDRALVERLAAALGLLPDAALEAINEAAFAAAGAPVLEGDEVLELDRDVLQEMLP